MLPDVEAEFSAEWHAEIERRVLEIEQGRAETVPWSQIHAEALARLNDDRRTSVPPGSSS